MEVERKAGVQAARLDRGCNLSHKLQGGVALVSGLDGQVAWVKLWSFRKTGSIFALRDGVTSFVLSFTFLQGILAS